MARSLPAAIPAWLPALDRDREPLPDGALLKFQLLARAAPETNFRVVVYTDGRAFVGGHSGARGGGAFDQPLPAAPRSAGAAFARELDRLLQESGLPTLPPYSGPARLGPDSVLYVLTAPAKGAPREVIWHWREGVTLPPLVVRLAGLRREIEGLPEAHHEVPDRLKPFFRLRRPLPAAARLRLQALGRGVHGGGNHAFEIDGDGILRRGQEALPARAGGLPPPSELALDGPSRRLDAAVVRRLAELLVEERFAEQPPYLGHPTAADGTIWVLTARTAGGVHEVVYEAYRPPLVARIEALIGAGP